MAYKPFKPPLPKARFPSPPPLSRKDSEPPAKKRRISEDTCQIITRCAPGVVARDGLSAPVNARSPLTTVRNAATPAPSSDKIPKSATPDIRHYNVLWRKITNKKNKTWDGDGVLSVSAGYAVLKDDSGKEMGKTANKGALLPGSTLTMSGKEVEIDSLISKSEYLKISQKRASVPSPRVEHSNRPQPALQARQSHELPRPLPTQSTSLPKSTAFRTPLVNSAVQVKQNLKTPVPRHCPDAEGALVMRRPVSIPKGKQVVDVVVDPMLSRHLREHQRTGVAFLYECVMGMRAFDGEGAILADEMGLGKTLQTIALVWTLLKQNPIYEEAPVVKKVLIVCPVSLTNNWRREFRKWLGNERIGVLVADDNKTRLTDFTKGRSYNVMIIGYEKLRMVQKDLQKGTGIDIVIADEGHRLKTAQNKSAAAIKSLNTERRIILSGTPLQNNLSEFYTMVDFVNPGLLSKYSTFKRDFENPIIRSKQPEATEREIDKGKEKQDELNQTTAQFILRRTTDVLAKYLPPKTEYVIFCRPTAEQTSVYKAVLSPSVFGAALNSPEMSLQLINILKKVCNSPALLLKDLESKSEESTSASVASLVSHIPAKVIRSAVTSGKIQVLDSLLHKLHTTTEDKIVLVSNYTSTLDRLEQLLNSLSYRFLRLDGSTPASKRQDLVDTFNRSPRDKHFVFLLSAKAGGLGLNLIGANRLVLFDIDWNPSVDLQAMARICRDGQEKACYIYRLLTKGALDEKIFQRQMTKQGLAESVVDSKSGTNTFSQDMLRDLFTLDMRPSCQTHDLLACACRQDGLDEQESHTTSKAATPLDQNDDGEEEFPDVDVPGGLKALPSFMRASQFGEEKERKAKDAFATRRAESDDSKSKMRGLMEYAHLDAMNAREQRKSGARSRNGVGDIEESKSTDFEALDEDEDVPESTNTLIAAIKDDVLRATIEDYDSRVDFVLTKSGSSQMDTFRDSPPAAKAVLA